jgi:hypothetical protein
MEIAVANVTPDISESLTQARPSVFDVRCTEYDEITQFIRWPKRGFPWKPRAC